MGRVLQSGFSCNNEWARVIYKLEEPEAGATFHVINNTNDGHIVVAVFLANDSPSPYVALSIEAGADNTFSYSNSTFWIAASQYPTVPTSAESNTEIITLGIKSADILVTGGGAGQNATPIAFTLANIVYA